MMLLTLYNLNFAVEALKVASFLVSIQATFMGNKKNIPILILYELRLRHLQQTAFRSIILGVM